MRGGFRRPSAEALGLASETFALGAWRGAFLTSISGAGSGLSGEDTTGVGVKDKA